MNDWNLYTHAQHMLINFILLGCWRPLINYEIMPVQKAKDRSKIKKLLFMNVINIFYKKYVCVINNKFSQMNNHRID